MRTAVAAPKSGARFRGGAGSGVSSGSGPAPLSFTARTWNRYPRFGSRPAAAAVTVCRVVAEPLPGMSVQADQLPAGNQRYWYFSIVGSPGSSQVSS